MMKKSFLAVAAACLLASTAAHAFQEQTTGAASSSQRATEKPAGELGLGDATQIKPDAAKGTEVRIPGLGRLGVLPKMDFGLELLYGAAELPLAGDQQFSEPDSDGDLKVRGTVKHRF
ncbi:MAG: hypothetical protein AAFV45_05660 [Pseudomonadota bacterium]